jgi:CDP-glucose 4,6-dehydratase
MFQGFMAWCADIGIAEKFGEQFMGAYTDVRVLVTGHTGFKGSWLCAWLKRESAIVAGLALPPPEGERSLFEGARVGEGIQSQYGDIREVDVVRAAIGEFQPDIIFHLAAQPLVRRSYREPIETYATNVMGTLHVLEAAGTCRSVRARRTTAA